MKHILITTIAAVVLVGCGGPSIHQATIDGEIALIRRELSNGANVNEKNEDGLTPLHLAVKSGHKRIVELLIAKGAGVNAKFEGGGTPLHGAAWNSRKEIVELLIAKGADVNAKRSDGGTSLGGVIQRIGWDSTEAIGRGYTEITDLLRKHGGKTAEELKVEGK